MANGLAQQYPFRGGVLSHAGDFPGALVDYGRAIDIQERLREQLGDAWSLDMASELATDDLGRGNVLASAGDRSGALDAYGRCIEILERLHAQLGEQEPFAVGGLLWVARERRAALNDTSDPGGFLEDYGRFIEAWEGTRERSGEEWDPDLTERLASAYLDRAVALEGSGDVNDAVRHYSRSIEIREGLRLRLGDQWSTDLAEQLAIAYTLRGDAAGEIEDLSRSIEIYERLRDRLGDQWSTDLAEQLAIVYGHRGRALITLRGDVAGEIGDLSRSIETYERLRDRLGDQWSVDLAEELARAFVQRGYSRQIGGDPSGALQDHQRCGRIVRAASTATGRSVVPSLGPRAGHREEVRGDGSRGPAMWFPPLRRSPPPWWFRG